MADVLEEIVDAVINVSGHVPDAHKRADLTDAILARLGTWEAIMAFADKHYPADVFPVGPDSEGSDDGVRILSLLRRIAELEHTITQYLDSHGTAGTGVLGKRLKAAVGRVE